MIDLENIKQFTTSYPEGWTIFGNKKDFEELPASYKDQIFFLNKDAEKYILQFLRDVNLITGGFWAPFEKGNFKTVEEFSAIYNSNERNPALRKWLYNRGIPFSNEVFILFNGNEPSILTTWKIVIKFSEDIVLTYDAVIFDRTLNWCMVYFHEGTIFFGKDNIYDPTEDYERVEKLNERKRKFPQFKHPLM